MEKKVYFIFLTLSCLWLGLIVLAPVLKQIGGFSLIISRFIYDFFSVSCHQIDSRSYFLWGNKLAVCSRCFLIYIGFVTGALAYPLISKKKKFTDIPSIWILLTAVLLLFTDAVLDISGILPNSFTTRAITGFLTGFVLTFYLIPGFTLFFTEIKSILKRKKKNEN
ncbi:MAG: DUF2085 domain-containing protein [Ignavibacteria bacterium]|nr:DUF2085 domain-containing protein [Ignavibacteria bacterium]